MSQNPSDNPNDPGMVDPALVNNPYLNAARAEPVPDLDAAAPQLRVEENQRMNRKALMFLGLLILRVLGMAWLRALMGLALPGTVGMVTVAALLALCLAWLELVRLLGQHLGLVRR